MLFFKYYKLLRIRVSIDIRKIYDDYGIGLKISVRKSYQLPTTANFKFQFLRYHFKLMVYKMGK